ncbi:MAG TPA: hypothetical protein VK255_00370 [Patescibacteria group bacterium]|nr:hypothetical protein [Patescibacteria group bacterium]
MNEQNNLPMAKKKSHWLRNTIIIVPSLILFVWLTQFLDGKRLTQISNSLHNVANISQIETVTDAQPSENYAIKQKSKMPFSMSAPRGVMNAKADINFITVGYPMSKAGWGKHGWQTDWKVIINSTTQTNTKTKIKDPSGLHSSALTTDFTPTNSQSIYYFSLANVKEGDAFDVRYVQQPIENATFHFNENTWIFYGKDNAPFQAISVGTQERDADVNNSGNISTLTAYLVKNNGAEGAIIGFKPVDLNAQQKGELDKISGIVNQPGVPDLTQFWNSQVNPMFQNLPQQPPLKIVLKNGFPEKGYFEEEITNANYVNAAPGADVSKEGNANDKNGDGIPDLVPLHP